jgi:transcriptional regulator of arginine metabolism
MEKHRRQFTIKQIITHQAIANQDELCKALKKAGFDVTQATLSRDMKELGIARVHTQDGVRYELRPESEERRLKAFIGYEVERIDSNEVFVVIKTLPGRAQGVAEIIDGLQHPLILGTIAGDNTIFVTPTTTRRIKEVLRYLKDLMTKERRVA